MRRKGLGCTFAAEQESIVVSVTVPDAEMNTAPPDCARRRRSHILDTTL